MASNIVVMWFRQDLRLTDSPALHAAAAVGLPVLPIYILDEVNPPQHQLMGRASKVWLHHALVDLNKNLGSALRIFSGDAHSILSQITSYHTVQAIYYNRCYEPWRMTRDSRIKKFFKEKKIEVNSYTGSLLNEPWQVLKDDGGHYKVFTPFYKRALDSTQPKGILPAQADLKLLEGEVPGAIELSALGLVETYGCPQINSWKVGERAAHEILGSFLENGLNFYKSRRDLPAEDGSSRLAPYLHFGHISPNYVLNKSYATGLGADFLRQMFWREFAYHTLYHNPTIAEACIQHEYENFPWTLDEAHFAAWKSGFTGYPIIDAGMRELEQTGYMHNRVRMLVASFLVKNLRIDWRLGQAWFWENLFDADLANNSFGWQWVAGCGTDAAPYFRIFNPTLQAKKFDPEGIYIKQYVPELKNLPIKHLIEPWHAPQALLREIGDYPMPIVDLKTTAKESLEFYKMTIKTR